MPGEAVRLGQILKFFNIRVRVSGEGTEAFFFFNLRQVCERKGNMNSHDTLSTSHLLEGVEGNQLIGSL
jgi:lipopolysaccharide biosynthesis protein